MSFESDCMAWRKRILSGVYAHYCSDWDGLPVDETTTGFASCNCEFSVDDGPVRTRHTFIANGGTFAGIEGDDSADTKGETGGVR